MAKTVLVFKESMQRNEELRQASEAEQRDREQRAEHMMNLTRAFDEQVKGMVDEKREHESGLHFHTSQVPFGP